jgi:hypothetical protein
MHTRLRKAAVHAFWSCGLLAAPAGADVKIVLKDAFIKKYMHRVTFDTCLYVDAVGRANFIDGDLHIAGISKEAELPTVAEIMNAHLVPEVRGFLRALEGTGRCVPMKGAWRFWCEHGRNDVFVQGAPVVLSGGDNPNHVFEIHPVTQVAGWFLPTTLRPIPGIATKNPRVAFPVYESTPCKIRHSSAEQVTSLESPIVWRNYPEFILQILDEPPQVVEDGRFLYGAVLDLDGKMLVSRRRMVLIADTLPELTLRRYKAGDRVHVLGMPRISLALVDHRVQMSAEHPEVLDGGLPYELVIVGVYLD